MQPKKKTLRPIVTGSSVLGIKYKDGVILASDTLGSYGSLARFRDIRRIVPITKHTVIGGTGEFSDFQEITKILRQKIIENQELVESGKEEDELLPSEIHSYLSRVLYGRRNKFNPLWNDVVVAGFEKGKVHMGTVDLWGSYFEDDIIATGYGTYFALPLMRKAYKKDMERDKALEVLRDCLTVLFYRDCRTINRYVFAEITKEGVNITEPVEIETKWEIADWQEGKL
ncbi:proteasome subunit beta type-4 [Anaeramoeba flamelloides]|uniref:Proteasome subunit beta n=1 Tax=Anaeramoeba flamelloides TaxID=1746091 RepID=A0AAV7Y379_9EUKA|nr:proteasome subunit beta type-4 [Anaeramoeba flamelloides]KAJ3426855.1 proteasome subunit beta type-4 [Anaeramoeba flamelloides]KAJ3444485.1 proteasome subunit beta type-4 [Anaeramoeba flamelloides]KAJ3444686.1 proteasome subunit beta type-4 [Anaeramoeba flamelloides]KAJ6227847.1 proteasome subunit beta type-4 [Anaeramoeba flamelloides]